MTDSDLNFLIAVIGCMLAVFWVIGRIWLAIAGRGSSSFGRSVAVRRSVVARPVAGIPATASPARKAASRSASLAAGGFRLAVPCIVVVVAIVVLPIAILLDGAEPGPVLGWMAMVAGVMISDYGVARTGNEAFDLRNLVMEMAEDRFRITKVPFQRKPSNPMARRLLLADAVNLERKRCPYSDRIVAQKLIAEEPFKERWGKVDAKTLSNWLIIARARFCSSSTRKFKRKRA